MDVYHPSTHYVHMCYVCGRNTTCGTRHARSRRSMCTLQIILSMYVFGEHISSLWLRRTDEAAGVACSRSSSRSSSTTGSRGSGTTLLEEQLPLLSQLSSGGAGSRGVGLRECHLGRHAPPLCRSLGVRGCGHMIWCLSCSRAGGAGP